MIPACPEPPLPAPPNPLRLSQEIAGLLESVQEHPILLHEIVEVLQGRAYNLLLILLALPFCTPILIPGLSTPFGWVMSIIGIRLALGQTPWLPKNVLNATLSPKWLKPLLTVALRVSRSMEWLLRPRLVWLVECSPLHRVYGILITCSGLLLLLPLPIPFSNLLPAISVAFLAAGMLERDGIAILCGCFAFLLTLVFFAFLAWGGKEATLWIISLRRSF